ncbi:hypothetical protein G9A89_007501 [Geosiphon pyriformis]|nr:hypothetical protein G9A89_007501 [Geosiphon pyriformis]
MDSLVKDPEIRVEVYILSDSLLEGHNCQNKSSHQAEKEIGKQLTNNDNTNIKSLELIQNTNLPTNHNFASIITEINKEIEHHTQQRYPITYASKDKGKLQTPAITPRKIQPPTWKKNRIESLSNPSYYYISGSTINISLIDVSPSTTTSAFG